MNLSLLDPFAVAQEYPDTLTQTLSFGQSVVIEFNRKGDYLASGCIDGTIVIFDMDTNGVILVLKGHTLPIQSISWSRSGRFILSSSRDWKCIFWDLLSGNKLKEIKFESAIYSAYLHPFNDYQFVASIYDDEPIWIDINLNDNNDEPIKIILPTLPLQQQQNGQNGNSNGNGNNNDDDNFEDIKKGKKKNVKQATLVAIFNHDGSYIFTGTSKGWFNIINSITKKTVYSERITSSSIREIIVNGTGDKIATNSTDRIIRQYKTPQHIEDEEEGIDEWEFELEHKFHDVVNRLQWNTIGFNHSGEYLMASTYDSGHDIYLWETGMGSLMKILEGPKEELVDVAWHPKKAMAAATGLDSGTVYIWSVIVPQKWSALAPDFVEIEENIEYEEKEDEFDIVAGEEMNQRELDHEDEFVDILTIERNKDENNNNTNHYRNISLIEKSFVIPARLDEPEVDPPEIED